MTTRKKTTKRKKTVSAKKLCSKVIKREGINQRTGQLKPGHKYLKGGRIVKVKSKK